MLQTSAVSGTGIEAPLCRPSDGCPSDPEPPLAWFCVEQVLESDLRDFGVPESGLWVFNIR